MCLQIPGQVVEVMAGNAGQLALVDVLGARRPINLGMLDDPVVAPGQWVLIHMGFALERVDAARAAEVSAGLAMLGRAADPPVPVPDGSVAASRNGVVEDA